MTALWRSIAAAPTWLQGAGWTLLVLLVARSLDTARAVTKEETRTTARVVRRARLLDLGASRNQGFLRLDCSLAVPTEQREVRFELDGEGVDLVGRYTGTVESRIPIFTTSDLGRHAPPGKIGDWVKVEGLLIFTLERVID